MKECEYYKQSPIQQTNYLSKQISTKATILLVCTICLNALLGHLILDNQGLAKAQLQIFQVLFSSKAKFYYRFVHDIGPCLKVINHLRSVDRKIKSDIAIFVNLQDTLTGIKVKKIVNQMYIHVLRSRPKQKQTLKSENEFSSLRYSLCSIIIKYKKIQPCWLGGRAVV